MTRSTLKRLLLQAAFVLSWSSGYIGAKLGTQGGGAFNLLFWRFLLVSVCLGLFLNVRLLKVSWAQVRHYAVIGFLSQFLYLSCLYVAIQNGSTNPATALPMVAVVALDPMWMHVAITFAHRLPVAVYCDIAPAFPTPIAA